MMGLGDGMVHIGIWTLLTFGVGLLLAFFGVVFATAKMMMAQHETRLNERFTAQDEARKAGQQLLSERFGAFEAAKLAETQQWRQTELAISDLKGQLPVTYVLRDDWIRSQTRLDVKFDGLANKIDQFLLQGSKS